MQEQCEVVLAGSVEIGDENEIVCLFFVNNSNVTNVAFYKQSFVLACLTYKMCSIFGTGQSTNSMA